MCWDHISPHYPALFHSCWPSSFPPNSPSSNPHVTLCFFYCSGHVIPRRQHFIVSPSSRAYSLSTTFSVMSPRPWKQFYKSCLGLNSQQSLFLSCWPIVRLLIDWHSQNKKNPLWPRLRTKHMSTGMGLCFCSHQKLVEFPVTSGQFCPCGGAQSRDGTSVSTVACASRGTRQSSLLHSVLPWVQKNKLCVPLDFLLANLISHSFNSSQSVVCMLYMCCFILTFFPGE